MKGCNVNNSMPADAGFLLDEYDGPRFWKFVNFHGGEAHHIDPLSTATGECWVWSGGCAGSKRHPYGTFRTPEGMRPAHRVAYRDFGGQISEGQVLDHLCRNTRCVRPDHLEPVTVRENIRRGAALKTHCPSGHEYTPDNTTMVSAPSGRRFRYCTECLLASKRRTRERAASRALV